MCLFIVLCSNRECFTHMNAHSVAVTIVVEGLSILCLQCKLGNHDHWTGRDVYSDTHSVTRGASFLAQLSWKLKWAFLITCRPSSVCLSVCPSVCKLFTFSSSSPEPLGQFQPNLAQSILGWRGFKFVKMKGPVLFKGEIFREKRKYIDEI